MRFELTLNRISKQRMLPMNYQYCISAWIYKVIGQADEEFATFLHSRGYGNSETKRYKLFCFDRLNFGIDAILHLLSMQIKTKIILKQELVYIN